MKKKTSHVYYIDRQIKSVGVYLSDINKLSPEQPDREKLTDEEFATIDKKQRQEEYDLWQKMRAGNMKARTELIHRNLRYVVTVAKSFLWSGAAIEDLIMAGNIGMIRAADRFDASLGNKFISYATWYVECEIKKTVTDFLNYGKVASSDTNTELLGARPNYYSDWDTRYRDSLETLKQRLNIRIFKGADRLLTDFIETMQSGLTTTDFMKTHRLTNRQMDYFLNMVREEGQKALLAA
jgi:RNA polymerase sigma factor (sigma-70 family)